MNQESLARIRQAPLWVVVVGGMALAAGWFIAALIGTSEALPHQVLVALRPVERAPDGFFIYVDGAPTGVAKGIQLGLAGLLFGGVPAALLATALAGFQRHREWSSVWTNLCFAGFVFQLSSLLITLLLLLLVILWGSTDVVVSVGGPLLLSAMCGSWGLCVWRGLQLKATVIPPTIAPLNGRVDR